MLRAARLAGASAPSSAPGCAGEAFLRRLLFIEALALNVDAKLVTPRPRTPRQRRPFYFYPDKPDDWRVSFRLLPSARSAGRTARRICRSTAHRDLELALPLCAAHKPQETRFWLARKLVRRSGAMDVQAAPNARRMPLDPDNAWPYAERLEAMLRAFNDPVRPAQRLARILARDEARAVRALTPTPAPLIDRFGVSSFKRCDAIVASRRRRRDRAQAQQWRADTS